jgi:hypothetical protein
MQQKEKEEKNAPVSFGNYLLFDWVLLGTMS